MRLFVALVPPPNVLDDLGRVVDGLRGGALDLGLRWTAVEQWHLTLTFLGDVDDTKLDELAARLERAAGRQPPVRLQVAGGGGFGSSRAARVLWAGVTGPADATQQLRRLAEATTAAGRRSGLDLGTARFRPHVTLARLKRPADVRELVGKLATYAGPEWRAERVELVRSHLGQGEGHRPRYETVGAWPLGNPPKSDQE